MMNKLSCVLGLLIVGGVCSQLFSAEELPIAGERKTQPGGKKLELASDGRTDYAIVEGPNPTPAERFAAQELSTHLARVTGATFKVISETTHVLPSRAVYVGWTKFAHGQGIECSRAGDEEWIIKSFGDNLVLTGGRPRGTLYSVYEFLEQQVGCRWFDELTATIPSQATLILKELDIRGQPAFWDRHIYTGTGDTEEEMTLRARNKDTRGQAAQFGFGNPSGCHTFYTYSSAFPADHPEYLALNSAGKRLVSPNGSGPGQICLTNREARKLVLKRLRTLIAKDHEDVANAKDGRKPTRVYDVSQNDIHWICQCPECKAFSEREGADSGPLIDFINSLADGIKDEYPGVFIQTFAYCNTIKPPKTVRPRDNVIIRLAQLNAEWSSDAIGQSWSIDEYPDLFRPMASGINRGACETLVKWSKIAKHMAYWDYWIQYGDTFPSPYANLHCLQSDLKLFRDCKVEIMFTECEAPETTSFFALKRWLGWKLMQNPDQDRTVLVKTFMEGFYGPAAGKMTEYLSYMERRIGAVPETKKMSAVKPPERPYLDLECYVTCQRLLDEAERLSCRNAVALLNVQRERPPVDAGCYCMWGQLEKQLPAGQSMPWDPEKLIKRYETIRLAQLEARYTKDVVKKESDALQKEIAKYRGIMESGKQ
jgi:hypothetical protein